MPLHVQIEMIGTREMSVTEHAMERSVSGVLACVAREFVRPRELPPTVAPVTHVRLLARVCTQMGLEVGRLCVGLAAPRVLAAVARLPLPRNSRSLPPRFCRLLFFMLSGADRVVSMRFAVRQNLVLVAGIVMVAIVVRLCFDEVTIVLAFLDWLLVVLRCVRIAPVVTIVGITVIVFVIVIVVLIRIVVFGGVVRSSCVAVIIAD